MLYTAGLFTQNNSKSTLLIEPINEKTLLMKNCSTSNDTRGHQLPLVNTCHYNLAQIKLFNHAYEIKSYGTPALKVLPLHRQHTRSYKDKTGEHYTNNYATPLMCQCHGIDAMCAYALGALSFQMCA